MHSLVSKRMFPAVVVVLLAATGGGALLSNDTTPATGQPVKAEDIRDQAKRFIGYYYSISLTEEQERLKTEALSAIPAPCCDGYSIATCCCPCNLAKAVWGLSHFLIAKQGYGADQVRAAVLSWLPTANPSGYAGNACYAGRCNTPFKHDGCGGMNERQVL